MFNFLIAILCVFGNSSCFNGFNSLALALALAVLCLSSPSLLQLLHPSFPLCCDILIQGGSLLCFSTDLHIYVCAGTGPFGSTCICSPFQLTLAEWMSEWVNEGRLYRNIHTLCLYIWTFFALHFSKCFDFGVKAAGSSTCKASKHWRLPYLHLNLEKLFVNFTQ